MAKKRLYLKVTEDKYELPLIVCDSVHELAKREGKNDSNISSQISRNIRLGVKSKYTRVEIDDECEE